MNILYSDKDIIVCIKPSGVLSTDEPGGMPSLLREALEDGQAEIRTVHRLDRVVGGLMVFARTQAAAASLSRQITEKYFRKEYMAVIHGAPKADEGRFDDLLFRSAAENKTYVVSRMRKGVRDAALEYRVLEKKEGLSLVSVHLLTGRTHQIRVQFSSRSMPLVGDRKYGAPEDNCETALWSSRLCFSHPRSGKKMDFILNPTGGYPWSLFGFDGESVPSVRQLPSVPVPDEDAACPHSEICGGCQYQGIPYPKQLEKKQEYLCQLLGGFCNIEPIIGMEQPQHYRCKVHAAFGTDKQGKIISGIYQPSTHKIVPVDSCLIEDTTADSIIRDIRLLMPSFKITAYDEKRNTGFLRHVLIRKGFYTRQIMVVLVAASPVFRSQKAFLKALLEKHPEITTVILNINSRYTPVILGREQKILYGPGYIEDTLCGLRFRISAKSFYQVNPVQAETLYRTAVSLAGLTGKEILLDAYCGTGTIGLAAASSCAQVLGVEISRDAVQDAVANAKANGIRNAWFTCADAVEYIGRLAEEGRHCDVVLMDPPRDGSSKAFLTSLLRIKPDRIVYVSCGPESLARDLKILTAGNYQVQKIQPVDMFPYTEHVETVVLLSKGNISSQNVRVEFSLEDIDMSRFQQGATYEQIQDWVQEKYGFHVSHLNIAQVKRKHGIIERENYNKAKSPDSRQPGCPDDKVKAIEAALKYFQMI